MKPKITLLFYLILLSNGVKAQVAIDTGHFNWSKIEDATPVTVVNTDADNGDGLNDGAMLLKSAATTPALQGLQYQLAGSPVDSEQINLEVNYYQIGSSYLKFKMQVYNVTDNAVLAESVITTATGVVGTTPLSYTFTASSVGDQIIVRFVRADDLNTTRQAGIDYLKVNGQFISMQAPPVSFDVSDFAWSKIEDTTPVSTVKTDADNGDGLNDGAVLIKGTANTPALQGTQYLLIGSPFANGQISIETKYWQTASSYCKFKIQVYNVTDNVVLAESAAVTTSTTAATLTLNYVFTASSEGDQIMIRFVRADDLNPVRQAGLDYVKVNGQFINMLPVCKPIFNFDLPLTTATTAEINDLAVIRTNLSNQLIGTSAPTSTQLNTAINDYNALNITVTGNTITGNPVTSVAQIGFLKTFARHLKFNPNDTNMSDMAVKAVWYISDQFCNKASVSSALTFYNYTTFSRAAVFLNSYLPDNVKALFGNSLAKETGNFRNLFDPNYDFNTTQTNSVISTDDIYLHSDVYLAYSDWFKTNDEKIRFLKTAKRFIDRFLIYTAGTQDGLKKDGLSYHHNNSYDSYMYAFGTVATDLKALEGTGFQIDQPSYLRFRDAIYTQAMYSNDAGIRPFTMNGRGPQARYTTLGSSTLANLAISGGKILGLSGADPVLAGLYNRKYGVNSQFNYSTVTPFEEGYIQFNSANLGIYRKNNWVASMRGESDKLWGGEIYATENRYGRYQGYGTLEIVYPGDAPTGNGFNVIGWDWNYNPGTTTIVLPWSKLQAEKERVDEYNTYGFAGSLTLNQANKSVLSKTIGQSGLFSMKFKERNNLGFGAVYGPTTHNATFEFTKTYFAVDDLIICLASGIKNDDATNPTVTTLFQRLNNNSNDVLVNGEVKTNQATDSFDSASANWIIDNYRTGYYVSPNSGTLKIRNSTQTTPYHTQVNPSDATIASNNGNNYHLAYLDHGTAPTNGSYEYVCIPSADASRMTQFAQQMQSDKPYTVYQNNTNQQIIEHKPSKTWAYALPAANTAIVDGLLKANDTPCLAMYKSSNGNDYSEIVLSVSNPDMGSEPSTPRMVTLTLNNEWAISQGNSNATIGSATADGTTITFSLADGLPVEITLARVFKPQTIAFDTLPTKIATDTAFDLTATASSNLPVAYTSSNTEVVTVSGSTVTIVGKGTATITAKQDGDAIYSAAEAVEQTLTVSPAVQTITFDAIPTKAISDAAFDLTATASSNLPVSYTSSNTDVATVSGSTVTIVGRGITTITASQEGNNIYDAAAAVEKIIRVNMEPTVTITSPSANANFESIANITITADAADADGNVTKVEFFNGETKLGEATTAPYSLDWNGVTAGSYTITAKATDNDNAVTTSTVVTINVVCPTVQLSIPDVYAMNPAIDDANTIYLGYGPTSLTLNSLVQGDQEVTYTWSTGAQTPSISVSGAGTYTVTASYAGGCQSTASITINTLDVRCGNNNDKVMICHNNNVICVAQSAVQNHLNHGDNLGSCNSTSRMTSKEEVSTSSNFAVYPNPVQDYFNVSISSKLDPNATIGIYNILGNKIHQVRFTAVPQNVFAGDLPSGNYIIVVQNGVETFRSTIVKQ